MKLRTNQKGFSVAHILMVAVLFGIIGVIALKVSNAQRVHPDNSNRDAAQQQVAASQQNGGEPSVLPAPAINKAGDLKKAQDVLDKIDPGEGLSDSAEIDNQLASF